MNLEIDLASLGRIYHAVFEVSVAMVPTLAAVYALSISLLGPAIASAQTASARLRRSVSIEIDRLTKAMKIAGSKSEAIVEAELRLKGCRRELASAERAARSLNLQSSVIFPGILFLVSASLTAIPEGQSTSTTPPSPWWLLSLVPFFAGLVLVVRVLRTIRSIVELSVPELEVVVDPDPQPWKVGLFHRLRVRSVLHKGSSLPRAQLVLFVPPGPIYTGEPIWTVAADDPLMPGYRAVGSKVWDYRALAAFEWEWHHLKPAQSGPVTLYVAVYGESYFREPQPISINVQ